VVRSACALLVLLAVAGCPGRTVKPRIPGAVYLAKIEVEGNHAIEDDDLIPGLTIYRAHLEGRSVDPYQLSQDTKRIRGAFVRLGFFDVTVDSKIVRDDQAETVTFTVKEGKRSNALVVFSGLPPELPEDYVRGKLELKSDGPFDYDLYDEGRDIVKALCEEVGYPYVVDDSVVTVEKSQYRAVASYRLDVGPRAAFGAITITGVPADGDLMRAIRGRLAFREGTIYSPALLAETSRSLYELGRFSQVRIDVDRENVSDVIPVAIRVTLPIGSLETRLGGGFGYEPLTYEARARGSLSFVPDEFPLQSYSIDARIAYTVDHGFEDFDPKGRILFGLQRLDFLRTRLTADLGAAFDYFTVEAYTAAGGLLRAGLSYPLAGRWLTMQLSWQLSYLFFSDLAPLLVKNDSDLDGDIDDNDSPICPECARDRVDLGLNEPELNGRYEQALVADMRDNPIEPRKGMFLALRMTEGTILAGGTLNYLMLQPDFRGYYPIGSRFVLAGRVRGGAIFGDVPVTQRFFSGGAQNHRGFSARRLSPVITRFNAAIQLVGAVEIGGSAFLEAGAEIRANIGTLAGFLVGTTLFLDAGDVGFSNDQLDVFDLHLAAGAGLFFKYGGFKIRVDVGKRINRYPVDALGNVHDGFYENMNIFLAVGETY
jgi:translocation and assembly module TamA